MNLVHSIDSKPLDLAILHEILSSGKKLSLSTEAITRIEKCRAYLDEKMSTVSKPIYGINTGFGALHNVKIKGEIPIFFLTLQHTTVMNKSRHID